MTVYQQHVVVGQTFFIGALSISGEEHHRMMSDLCTLAEKGKLRPKPSVEYQLEDYKAALSKAMQPFVGEKQLLKMKSV